MKIAVLVKQVVGSESALEISQDQKWIDNSSATFVMNPPDNYAIEEAMLIKEKIGVGEVVIVSMGPQRVQKVIREGLSKGADRGIHIETESLKEIDPLYTSKVLAETLRDENFDLSEIDYNNKFSRDWKRILNNKNSIIEDNKIQLYSEQNTLKRKILRVIRTFLHYLLFFLPYDSYLCAKLRFMPSLRMNKSAKK